MVTSGFFNSLNGDRKYDTVQWSSLLDGVIENGVFEHSNGGALPFGCKVISGMRVGVDPGKSWFLRTWLLNDAIEPFDIEVGEAYARYDAIVVNHNLDVSVRRNTLMYVKGVATPTAKRPEMITTASVEQHPVCYILVPAGATTLTQSAIENRAGISDDNGHTPFVEAPLRTINLAVVWSNWNAQWQEAFASWQSAWADFQADMDAQKAAYFENANSEWTNWMADKDVSWADYMSAKETAWTTYLADKTAQFTQMYDNMVAQWQIMQTNWNAWFENTDHEWNGDPTNPNLPGLKAEINADWLAFKATVDAWMEDIQDKINLNEESVIVLSQEIKDLDGECDAVYNSTTKTVTISIPTGSFKTVGLTRYPIWFKAPVGFSTNDTYMFKESATISAFRMWIAHSSERALEDGAWESGSIIWLFRDDTDFYFEGFVSDVNKVSKVFTSSPYDRVYGRTPQGLETTYDVNPMGDVIAGNLARYDDYDNLLTGYTPMYDNSTVPKTWVEKRTAPPLTITTGTGAAYLAEVEGATPGGSPLVSGQRARLKFHTIATTVTPTLNVNGSGAKYIREASNANITATTAIPVNTILDLEYDGTYWIIVGTPYVAPYTAPALVTRAQAQTPSNTTIYSWTPQRVHEAMDKYMVSTTTSSNITGIQQLIDAFYAETTSRNLTIKVVGNWSLGAPTTAYWKSVQLFDSSSAYLTRNVTTVFHVNKPSTSTQNGMLTLDFSECVLTVPNMTVSNTSLPMMGSYSFIVTNGAARCKVKGLNITWQVSSPFYYGYGLSTQNICVLGAGTSVLTVEDSNIVTYARMTSTTAIVASTPTNYVIGVDAIYSSNVTVKNCQFYQNTYSAPTAVSRSISMAVGVGFCAYKTTNYSMLKVLDCEFFDGTNVSSNSQRNGIYANQGNNWQLFVENCKFHGQFSILLYAHGSASVMNNVFAHSSALVTIFSSSGQGQAIVMGNIVTPSSIFVDGTTISASTARTNAACYCPAYSNKFGRILSA